MQNIIKKEPKLTDFVNKTIEEISKGIPKDYRLDTRLFFELSIVTSTNKNGKLTIKVLSGDIGQEIKNIQKIKFSVVNENSEKKDMITAKKGIKTIIQDTTPNPLSHRIFNNSVTIIITIILINY